MTFRDYILVMALATAAAWLGWVVVVYTIDPTMTGTLGFIFFYLTLSVALLGTLSIIGAAVRIWTKREELVSRHVSRSFRQAVLLSTLFVGSLYLLSRGLLTWWVMLLLVVALALVELAFLSAQRQRTGTSH
jgi:hypothetical protein